MGQKIEVNFYTETGKEGKKKKKKKAKKELTSKKLRKFSFSKFSHFLWILKEGHAPKIYLCGMLDAERMMSQDNKYLK